jgi:hypothetical protein
MARETASNKRLTTLKSVYMLNIKLTETLRLIEVEMII